MNKYIIWIFLFILIIFIPHSAFSEGKINDLQTDSLRKEINNKKGLEKISAQLSLALEIAENDKHEARSLASSALLAAKKAGNKSVEMRSYYVLGRIAQILDDKELSETYYDTALTIAEVTGDNWYKGEILFHKGIIKHNSREEIKALEYFNTSLQACRLSNNFKFMGSSYSIMGTIFRVNGMYDRAIEYTVNSKLNYEKAGFLEGTAWTAYILGRIYSDLKLPQKALENFQEALGIYLKLASIDGNKNGVAMCYEQIGLLNLDSGNFEEARRYIDKTLKIYTASKLEYGLSNSYKNLGKIEYLKGNYELAEKYLKESLEVKEEVGDFRGLPTLYEYLGLCRIGKGQIEDGFNNLQQGLAFAISNNQKKSN